MTQAIEQFSEPEKTGSIQCSLCLQDISIPLSPDKKTVSQTQLSWVKCPVCNYHQPLKKTPGFRDMLVFGGVIGSVYIATIIAVLLTR